MKIRLFTVILYAVLGFTLSLYYNTYYVKTVDPKIQPYYDVFMYHVEKKCDSSQYKNSSFKINFNKLEEKDDAQTIGVCYTFKYSDKFSIELSEAYWDSAPDEARYHLIAHEALHCLFNLDHVDDPRDIMYFRLNYLNMDEVVRQIDKYLERECQK